MEVEGHDGQGVSYSAYPEKPLLTNQETSEEIDWKEVVFQHAEFKSHDWNLLGLFSTSSYNKFQHHVKKN